MNKLILCRLATIGCGLLAIVAYTRPSTAVSHFNDWNVAALGILSAIFGTQWVEYQKRQTVVITQTSRFNWLRKLLFSGLFGMTIITTNAQTNWSAKPRLSHSLGDVAYGAGMYVAVGDYGLIQTSTDGATWINQASSQLEADGFVAITYANNKFVIVGKNGRVLTSTNGLTWTPQASGTNQALFGITYGGGKFVAVGWAGTILTSTDAVTWVKQVSNTTYVLISIAYGGNQFVTVGQYGMLMTSPDGITWTERSLPVSGFDLNGITTGPNGSFVAVGGLSAVVTSPNGIDWTYRPVAGFTGCLTSVAYNPAQGHYIAVALQSNQLVLSMDGINWKAVSSGTPISLSGVRYIQGRFVAMGEGASLHTWTNGSTFRPLTINEEVALHGAVFGNGRYVAVGTYASAYHPFTANIAVTSTDGVNYAVGETTHFATSAKQFNAVAFGNGLFVAVGEDATIQTSTDGKSWESRQLLAGKTLHAVTFGGGQFVAVGENGLVSRSTDGKAWSTGYSGPAGTYKGITYANGLFMAVGYGGAIATSTNGLLWTIQPSITTKQFESITYGNGTWVGVGTDGLVGWSFNGTLWFTQSIPNVDLTSVTYGNGQFVAVGITGKIITSFNGISWTARSCKTSAHLWSVVHGSNQFVAVGAISSTNLPYDATIITSADDKTKSVNAIGTAADAQARVGAGEPEPGVGLQANVYPNPVVDDFTVAIDGVGDQPVRLWLVDVSGHTVIDKQITVGAGSQQEAMSLVRQEPGMYLLRVSTAGQLKTLKVLKQ